TWAREREAQLSQARALGAEFAHRLEVEFQRLSAVSETLALSGSGGDCEAMRSSFRRIAEHFPSILGIRRQHGSETCELLDPRRFPPQEMNRWMERPDTASPPGLTTMRGPYVTPGGAKVVLVEHPVTA